MRNLDPLMVEAIQSGYICPVILVQLTFKTATRYIWSGIGDLTWDAQVFKGVGSLGQIGTVTESVDVRAAGTSVSLSGIDQTLLGESLADIQLGAPANIWLGLFQSGQLLGAPYLLFSGTVDKPVTHIGTERCSIELALETKMINLQRANVRRYTSADQRRYFPDDTGFAWVESLNDIAVRWGS